MSDNSFGDEETRMPVDPSEKKDVLGSGDVLGDYLIVGLLGRGGMGEVYRAENRVTGRQVALKVISREATRGADFVERFKLEARVMSDLEHPGIVRVHHAGEANGRYYLTMDLVEGGTLEEYLDKGEGIKDNGGEDQVRDIAIQICEALAYAHGKGIVHRDLKPGNIMLARSPAVPAGNGGVPGRGLPVYVKITDFGLAKAVGEDFLSEMVKQSVSLSLGKSIGDLPTKTGSANRPRYEGTSTGAILGTYDYMSPEQKVGAEVTQQSDLYSLGVILYKLLTGRKPVGRAKPVSHYGVSASWDPIVDKLLEEEFLERYGSAEEVLDDVESINLDHSSRRGMGKAAAGIVCLILVVAGSWWWLKRPMVPNPNPPFTSVSTTPDERVNDEPILEVPPTRLPEPIATSTPIPWPTATPVPVATSTPRPLPSPTPVPLAPTPLPVPTATPSPQPTSTPRPVPTFTPRPVPTATPRPLPTPVPTRIPQPTATPLPKLLIPPEPRKGEVAFLFTSPGGMEMTLNNIRYRVGDHMLVGLPPGIHFFELHTPGGRTVYGKLTVHRIQSEVVNAAVFGASPDAGGILFQKKHVEMALRGQPVRYGLTTLGNDHRPLKVAEYILSLRKMK